MILKILNALLGLLLLLFAVVQVNDPDGWFWSLIYLIPVVGAGVAAFGTTLFKKRFLMPVFFLVLGMLMLLTIYYWPRTPEFWKQEVWWNTETAREGLGMMIATMAFAFSTFTVWRRKKSAR
ncbi:MAG: transmembrane 220 family protein [Verrucomicrobiota bacterium]